MKYIHIVAGFLALLSGFVALYSTKGSTLHRQGGRVFVIAMLVMTSLGALLASWNHDPGSKISVFAGLFTYYLVCTSLLTVQRPLAEVRPLAIGLMLMAVMVGLYAISLGLQASDSPNGRFDGTPAGAYFVVSALPLLCALLDARLLIAGSIQGRHRLARHLWRMGFAMFVATGSFFLGQADMFPTAIRKSGVLTIPVLLVIGMIVFCLVKLAVQGVRARRRAQPRPGGVFAHAMVNRDPV